MKVSLETIQNTDFWAKAGVRLPQYDVAAMRRATKAAPIWVHFGAGNIFRAFIAVLQQRLLDEGLSDRGIIAADTFDVDNIRMIYGGYDNLTMSVTLNADATIDKEIVASVSEALVAQLLPQVMMLKFHAAILDSAAAEQAARTIAMQTATDNAEDLLGELTLEYNKGRQQKITAEILDLLGGSQ